MSEDWRFKGISLAAAGSVLWGASGIAGQYILVERGDFTGVAHLYTPHLCGGNTFVD